MTTVVTVFFSAFIGGFFTFLLAVRMAKNSQKREEAEISALVERLEAQRMVASAIEKLVPYGVGKDFEFSTARNILQEALKRI